MTKEIERKFLVKNNSWKPKAGQGILFRQGYLNREKERTVRVRLAGDRGFLTIKGLTLGISRPEYEYEIPSKDAEDLLKKLCEKPLVEKVRYRVAFRGVEFEIDEFLGENKGLILAEVELDSEDRSFEKPDWLGKEVSHDPRYYNSNLTKHPFLRW